MVSTKRVAKKRGPVLPRPESPKKDIPAPSARVLELSAPKKAESAKKKPRSESVKRMPASEIEAKCESLYHVGQDRNTMLERKRQQKEEAMMKEVKPKPEVSSHAKKLPDRTAVEFLAAQDEWMKRCARRLERKKEKLEKEKEPVKESDFLALNKNKKIMEEVKEKYVSCTDYRIFNEQREIHLKKLHQQFDPTFAPVLRSAAVKSPNKSKSPSKRDASPTTTTSTAGAAAAAVAVKKDNAGAESSNQEEEEEEDPVGVRLYVAAIKQREHRQQLEAAKKAKDDESAQVPPKIVRHPRYIDAHLSEMLERSDAAVLRAEARRAKDKNAAAAFDESFTPFVTDRSRILAEKHRLRKLREHEEKMIAWEEEQRQKADEEFAKQQQHQHGGFGAAAQNNNNSSSSGGGSKLPEERKKAMTDFILRNEKLVAVRRQLERTKAELDFEREGKHCTFSPEINHAPKWLARIDAGGDVFNRLTPQYDPRDFRSSSGDDTMRQQQQQSKRQSLQRSGTANSNSHNSNNNNNNSRPNSASPPNRSHNSSGTNNNVSSNSIQQQQQQQPSSYEQQFALMREVHDTLSTSGAAATAGGKPGRNLYGGAGGYAALHQHQQKEAQEAQVQQEQKSAQRAAAREVKQHQQQQPAPQNVVAEKKPASTTSSQQPPLSQPQPHHPRTSSMSSSAAGGGGAVMSPSPKNPAATAPSVSAAAARSATPPADRAQQQQQKAPVPSKPVASTTGGGGDLLGGFKSTLDEWKMLEADAMIAGLDDDEEEIQN